MRRQMHALENCRLSCDLSEELLVCIVRFREDLQFGVQIPQMPAVMSQVTVSKRFVSPSGRYIRFGGAQGDELVGWMRRDYLEVCEVLGVFVDGKVEELSGELNVVNGCVG